MSYCAASASLALKCSESSRPPIGETALRVELAPWSSKLWLILANHGSNRAT